jgi:flagellar biosynthesis/type III secretory pathway M-ring protein FliF/YscJ
VSTWKQKQVSPVVAWVIIIAVIFVAVVTIWRYTGSPGRRGLTEEQRRQLEQMFGNQPPGPGNLPAQNAPTAR